MGSSSESPSSSHVLLPLPNHAFSDINSDGVGEPLFVAARYVDAIRRYI